MTTNEVLTLIALVGGPISAVLITRYLDDLRQYRARRMDVFRTLMRTRRTALHPDHIGALNLVEIEYANDPQVLTAWKALFTNFGSTLGRLEVERTEGLTDQKQIDARNQAFGTRAVQERQKLLAKLLHAMARVLGFKIEQLEIFEGGYTPQLWANVEKRPGGYPEIRCRARAWTGHRAYGCYRLSGGALRRGSINGSVNYEDRI
jgi:hypothetical protein